MSGSLSLLARIDQPAQLARALSPVHAGVLLDTLAADGRPLSALIAAPGPAACGATLSVRPVNLLLVRGPDGPGEKVVCVATDDALALPAAPRAEIERFYGAGAELVWSGPDAALDRVLQGRAGWAAATPRIA
jgi:inorganic pyrophosphatase